MTEHTRRATLALGADGALATTNPAQAAEHEPLVAMWDQWVEAFEQSMILDDAAARDEAWAIQVAILDAAPVTLAGLAVQARFFAIEIHGSGGGIQTEEWCLTHLERLERMAGLEPSSYVRNLDSIDEPAAPSF